MMQMNENTCDKLNVNNQFPGIPVFRNQTRVKCDLSFAEWANQLGS